MLLTTPYIPYETRPRVISEIRKSESGVRDHQGRHRLSGELLVRYGKEGQWRSRRLSIRGGQLLVGAGPLAGAGPGDARGQSVRIPLRRLSLSAGASPNSLSLIRGQNVVITLQTTSETSFDTWVKAIAIELIRQTPLEDIKYFDILAIDKSWKTDKTDQNSNFLPPCEKAKVKIVEPSTDATLPRKPRRYLSPNNCHEKLRTRSKSCNAVPRETVDESSVQILFKKCQNSENYVPVKEKLLLFETLCRLGRKVRSTEDISEKHDSGTKRAKSLHDLSFNSAPVKQICQYFETRSDSNLNAKSNLKSYG